LSLPPSRRGMEALLTVTSTSTSMTSTMRQSGSGGGLLAGRGDRDFGALKWDIEVQLSVVSGSGTPGGSMGGGGKKGGVGLTRWRVSIE
jgi:hypothetical protein